jgi:hypothetical protein
MDGKRVSLNYLSVGIFTFQLEDKVKFSEPSVWQGEIGEIKDFEMVNCTVTNGVIKAEGEHSQGLQKFKVTGKKVSDVQEWKAYYKQNEHADQMKLSTFKIGQDGLVKGAGDDSVGVFSIDGSYKNHEISWVKQYEGAHAIYYKG